MFEIHVAVGNILRDLSVPGAEVMLDKACGGKGEIRLYGRDAEITRVDAAIIFKNEIKVVVEIEFSNQRPIAFCGKVLGTAISTNFKLGKIKIPLSNSMQFIQVIQHSAGNSQSSKLSQCQYLQEAIGDHMTAAKNRIINYKFHYGLPEEFAAEGSSDAKDIRDEITSFLSLQ